MVNEKISLERIILQNINVKMEGKVFLLSAGIYNANLPDNKNGFLKAAYTTETNNFDSKALIPKAVRT